VAVAPAATRVAIAPAAITAIAPIAAIAAAVVAIIATAAAAIIVMAAPAATVPVAATATPAIPAATTATPAMCVAATAAASRPAAATAAIPVAATATIAIVPAAAIAMTPTTAAAVARAVAAETRATVSARGTALGGRRPAPDVPPTRRARLPLQPAATAGEEAGPAHSVRWPAARKQYRPTPLRARRRRRIWGGWRNAVWAPPPVGRAAARVAAPIVRSTALQRALTRVPPAVRGTPARVSLPVVHPVGRPLAGIPLDVWAVVPGRWGPMAVVPPTVIADRGYPNGTAARLRALARVAVATKRPLAVMPPGVWWASAKVASPSGRPVMGATALQGALVWVALATRESVKVATPRGRPSARVTPV